MGAVCLHRSGMLLIGEGEREERREREERELAAEEEEEEVKQESDLGERRRGGEVNPLRRQRGTGTDSSQLSVCQSITH